MLAGDVVGDTISPLLVWETPNFPTYYFPAGDVKTDLLVATAERRTAPGLGEAISYTVKVGDTEGSAYSFHEPEIPEIADHFVLVWRTMDHWFEEDEEVFVHARNPYTRIDILHSSRRVRVVIDGVTVADSRGACLLFETGLPTRFYLPKTHVRMDLLTPTDKMTGCPYKGFARYWTASVNGSSHENIVWGYDTPLPESDGIAGMVSFYNERVDIYLDEVLQARPKTRFS